MQRSKLPYFFLGLAAVLAASALVLLALKLIERNRAAKPPPPKAPAAVITPPAPIEGLDQPLKPEDPAKTLEDLGLGISTSDPAELVGRIAKALESGDLATLGKLIGKDALDPATAERLKALSAANVRLRQPDGVREVGELELNARTRWALELDGAVRLLERLVVATREVEDLREPQHVDGVHRVELL